MQSQEGSGVVPVANDVVANDVVVNVVDAGVVVETRVGLVVEE